MNLYLFIGMFTAVIWIVWSAYKRPLRFESKDAIDNLMEGFATLAITVVVFFLWGLIFVIFPFYGLFRVLFWLFENDDTRKRKDESY